MSGGPGSGAQRRGRSIAMTAAELDGFLAGEHTCRVATTGSNGPHVAPLWFVWDGTALWLNSLVRSQRWTDLGQDPRIAVVVDAGTEYGELRGVELSGRAQVVGEVPRGALKYRGAEEFTPDGRHAWLRLRPDRVVSWDFRKNPALRSG
jgi:hypothetical protein